MRDMLRALPSLVDINVPGGKHFTVCGDVHGQVIEHYWGEKKKFICFQHYVFALFLSPQAYMQ